MSDELIIEELGFKASMEGLSYAILHYYGDDVIDRIRKVDPELADDWAAARTALARIETKLEPHYA